MDCLNKMPNNKYHTEIRLAIGQSFLNLKHDFVKIFNTPDGSTVKQPKWGQIKTKYKIKLTNIEFFLLQNCLFFFPCKHQNISMFLAHDPTIEPKHITKATHYRQQITDEQTY